MTFTYFLVKFQTNPFFLEFIKGKEIVISVQPLGSYHKHLNSKIRDHIISIDGAHRKRFDCPFLFQGGGGGEE